MLHITLKNEQLFLTTIHMRKWSQKNMTTLYMSLGLYSKNEEEKSKIERGVAWLLRKLGSNIISGQSIMNISLPVFLFDKRTMHEVFCYEHKGAPYYLSRAAHCTDKIERMKFNQSHSILF